MDKQLLVKSLYLTVIFVLLAAIGVVQLNNPIAGTHAVTKQEGSADEQPNSVFSMADAIARLYFLLPVFTEQDRRDELSVDERVAVEREFVSLLNRLPEKTITDKMIDLKLATETQLSRIPDHRLFINRLARVGMNGIITSGITENPSYGYVLFKVNPEGRVTDEFTSGTETIYAYFDSGGYTDKTVFVKWYEMDTGRMSLFKQFPINQGDVNYIWIEDKKGLPSGNYQVEIYRINQALELLSIGRYQID